MHLVWWRKCSFILLSKVWNYGSFVKISYGGNIKSWRICKKMLWRKFYSIDEFRKYFMKEISWYRWTGFIYYGGNVKLWRNWEHILWRKLMLWRKWRKETQLIETLMIIQYVVILPVLITLYYTARNVLLFFQCYFTYIITLLEIWSISPVYFYTVRKMK